MHLLIKRIVITFFWVLCFLFQPVYSDADTLHTMSQENWQRLTSDKAFGYRDDKESVQQIQNHSANVFQKILQALLGFFDTSMGATLLWVLAIGIVMYVLYRLFLSRDSFVFGRSKKKMVATQSSMQEELDMASTNWEGLLQNAVANNDLRTAVRYSYMLLLQLLQKQDLIQYRNDKTNFEYYNELTDAKYKQPFKNLSRQYEYTWYGNFAISKAYYDNYIALFNNLKNQLQP